MLPRTVQAGHKTLILRQAAVDEIIPLRHRILRAGLPIEEAHFDGDRDPSTRHAAAFDEPSAAGCATMVLNQWDGEPAWQLRGMATDAAFRGKGVGRALLDVLEEDRRDRHRHWYIGEVFGPADAVV